MKLIVAIFFLPILAIAQVGQSVSFSNLRVSEYLQAYANVGGKKPASLDRTLYFLNMLSDKREKFKNEQTFLEHVFTKTHQRFLKQYKEYATFNELLLEGNYNCMTATALYALILEHLGFEYEIIETNYHIFLVAETAYGPVLLETTDPLQGFVTKNQEIERKISQYRQNTQVESNNNKTYYQYNVSLFNSIGLKSLHGLLYYNLAVDAYNKQDLLSTVDYLEKACLLYESQRLEEFSKIIVLTLLESKINTEIKENLLRRIQSIKDHQLRVVASTKTF